MNVKKLVGLEFGQIGAIYRPIGLHLIRNQNNIDRKSYLINIIIINTRFNN